MSKTVLVGLSVDYQISQRIPLDATGEKNLLPDGSITFCASGSSLNVYTGLKKAGIPVKLIATVSAVRDGFADLLSGELRGIDAYELPIRTGTNISIINLPEGQRRVVNAQKSGYILDKLAEAEDVIREQVRILRPDVRVMTGVQLADARLALAMFQQSCHGDEGPKEHQNVMVPGKTLLERHSDPSMEEQRQRMLRELLAHVNLLVMNDEEWGYTKESMNVEHPSDLKRFGPPGQKMRVIITHGPEGATLFNGHEEPLFVPAFKDMPVVDSTGAGDTFLAFFLAAELRGEDPTRSMHHGCAGAAHIIGRQGTAMIPDWADTARLVAMRSDASA